MANTTGKKFGGRQKGTPNKSTDKVRRHFEKLLTDNLGRLQHDVDVLEPKDRVKVLLEMAKFVIPTLRAAELDVNADVTTQDNKPTTIIFK